MIRRTLLYLRTIRHLQPKQLVYQIVRRIQRNSVRIRRTDPCGGSLQSPALCALFDSDDDADAALERARAVAAGSFRFLEQEQQLAIPDWRRRHVSHLWNYNLHYHDFVLDLARAFRRTRNPRFLVRMDELVLSWIEQIGRGGGDGWEPYAISLRTANWLRVLTLLGDKLPPNTRNTMRQSLCRQLDQLERRIEWHIGANHVQKNLHALALAAVLLPGRRMRLDALPMLWRQMALQVLPDGVQYERSPMYHAIACGDFMELLGVLGAAGIVPPAPCVARIRAMYGAWQLLCQTDGAPALFNDSADGVAPSASRLRGLAARVLEPVAEPVSGGWALNHAGYYGFLRPDLGERFIIDCGLPGPPEQPAHAHCDLLSFELELGGRHVVVDSGVCGYEGDVLRDYVRSTRAHNTVMVADREQTETWGTFRVARRARPVHAAWDGDYDHFSFRGTYVPFHDHKVRHEREATRVTDGWRISDRVSGAEGVDLRSFVHLHPDLEPRVVDGRVVARFDAAHHLVLETWGADDVTLRRGEMNPPQGWYCPRFGRRIPSSAVEITIRRNAGAHFGYLIRLQRCTETPA